MCAFKDTALVKSALLLDLTKKCTRLAETDKSGIQADTAACKTLAMRPKIQANFGMVESVEISLLKDEDSAKRLMLFLITIPVPEKVASVATYLPTPLYH